MENLKYIELKEKCKKYNLPSYGLKKVLIQRLKKHLETHQPSISENDENDDDNVSEINLRIEESNEDICLEDVPIVNEVEEDEEDEEEYEENVADPKSKKRKRFIFVYSNDFDDIDDALAKVENELIEDQLAWMFDRNRNTKHGLKRFYRCRINLNCNKNYS